MKSQQLALSKVVVLGRPEKLGFWNAGLLFTKSRMGATMEMECAARDLVVAVANALRRASEPDGDVHPFNYQLISELGSCTPKLNPKLPEGVPLPDKLKVEFTDRSAASVTSVMGCLRPALPQCSWFRADSFYNEEHHRKFSEKVWGALILGQDDAVFAVNDQFIALIIIIEPNTVYPLHAHRIEETYLILAGDAEWSHDGLVWERLSLGMTFHNRSWEPHTMRTGTAPLVSLGLYLPPFGWEGGLLEAQWPN